MEGQENRSYLSLLQHCGANTEVDYFLAYMHVLVAQSCALKGYDDQHPFQNNLAAWESPLAAPMRRYIDVLALKSNLQFDDADVFQDLSDQLIKVDMQTYLEEFCGTLISGSFSNVLAYLLPQHLPNNRERFYALTQMLLVMKLHNTIEKRPFRTDELNRTDDEFFQHLLAESYDALGPEAQDVYHKIRDLDQQKIYQLWLHMYGEPITQLKVSRSYYTSESLKLMKNAGMSYEQQFSVYCCARLYAVLLQNKKDNIESPYRYLRKIFDQERENLESENWAAILQPVNKENGSISYQRDYFYQKALFDKTVKKLRNVEPVQFLLNVKQYAKRRLELAAENDSVYPAFIRRAGTARSLIVEPNPLLAERISQLSREERPMLAFLSVHEAYLYLTQFQDAKIGYLDIKSMQLNRLDLSFRYNDYSFYQTEVPTETFHSILAFWRKNDQESCVRMSECLSRYLSEDGVLYEYIPTSLYDQLETRKKLAAQYVCERLTVYPSYQTDTAQGALKKYLLLWLRKRAGEGTEQYIPAKKKVLLTQDSNQFLADHPHETKIPVDILLGSGKTMSWLWSNQHTFGEKKKERITRVYEYTPEIRLWYHWSEHSKTGAYYYPGGTGGEAEGSCGKSPGGQ